MNPPKMPIHIGDTLRETGNLRAAAFGAYLLLQFHQWATGTLPDDDEQLATLARMTGGEWRRTRPLLEKLFQPGWRHGRVEEDLASARASYEKRAKAGEKGGKAKAEGKQSSSNATAGPEQPLTFNLDKKDAADAAPENLEKQFFDRGKQVLGPTAGGLLRRLLTKKNNDIALARAAIEQASTKQDPREYVGRIVNGRDEKDAGLFWRSGIEGVT